MNASRHFANTSNKRNRRQLSRSALAQTQPVPRLLGTVQFAGAAEFETVTGREYRNVTASRPERGFSPISIKQTRRPAVAICGAVSCNPTLSAREAAASRLAVVPRLPDEGGLAKTGPPRRSLGEGGLSVETLACA